MEKSSIYKLSKISQSELLDEILDALSDEEDTIGVKEANPKTVIQPAEKRKIDELCNSALKATSNKNVDPLEINLISSDEEDYDDEIVCLPITKKFSPIKPQPKITPLKSTSSESNGISTLSPNNLSSNDMNDLDVSFTESEWEEYEKKREETIRVKYLLNYKQFKWRKGAELGPLFQQIADSFELPADHVTLYYEKKRLTDNDTLLSLKYRIGDYFELFYSKKQNAPAEIVEEPDNYKLTFIDQDKNKFTIGRLRENMKISELIELISAEKSKPTSCIRLSFDGESLKPDKTLQHYELEDGFMCEIRFLK